MINGMFAMVLDSGITFCQSLQSRVPLRGKILKLYDETYGLDPGDGDIVAIETGFTYNQNGEFNSANIIIPSGVVLIAIREYYTIGSYTGKIKITKSDGSIEILNKIFSIFTKMVDLSNTITLIT